MQLDAIREQHPITRHFNFQNHAAIAPISAPAAEAMVGYAREMAESAYLGGKYYRAAERVRTSAAKLINADPLEITFVKNTCEGVNYIANGVEWLTRDNVVTTSMEFPANLYPWLVLEQRGVNLIRIEEEDGHIPFDRIAAAINARTRLVTVSAVQWSNGVRMDLTRLGEMCKEKGVLLFVDAIQALGVHPIDVREMNIDFLSAGGHKWLTAPEGTGVFYCKRELCEHIKPPAIGYMCMKEPFKHDVRKFDPRELHEDARRFDSGVYNTAGICALGASIDLLLEIGIPEVQVRVKQLTDLLVEGLRTKGWEVHSPRTASEWSGIVSFSSRKHDMEEIQRHLREEFKVVIAKRLERLRASPHYYNSADEVRQLVEALPPG